MTTLYQPTTADMVEAIGMRVLRIQRICAGSRATMDVATV